jgi:hypothetical protein
MIIQKGPNCDSAAIIELVQRRISGSSVENTPDELNFFLPEEASAAFPGLYEELEKKSKVLGSEKMLNVYHTMDEVLLNIKKSATDIDLELTERQLIYQQAGEVKIDEDYKKVGCLLHTFRQFHQFMLKNLKFTIRRRFSFVISVCSQF